MNEARFVFNPATGEMFTLNGTGALVYHLHRDGLTPEAIAVRVASTYGVAESEALDDVRAFLAQLRVNGVLADA